MTPMANFAGAEGFRCRFASATQLHGHDRGENDYECGIERLEPAGGNDKVPT